MQARKGKWQPFDALEGYKDALRKVEYEIGKIPKPELSEYELADLDFNLKEAVKKKSYVEIVYFNDGYVYRLYDYITSLDQYTRRITIGRKQLNMDDVIEINICD